MKKPNDTKLPAWLVALVVLSVLIAAIAFGLYVWQFGDNLSIQQETWGQFGDFIGGTLNPLFALTALLALLYTIILQSTELRNSAEQLERSAEALQSQNSVLKSQNFDATFFQLLSLYNEIVNQLNILNRPEVKGITVNRDLNNRKCIEHLHKKLMNDYMVRVMRGDYTEPLHKAIDIVYTEFYEEYGSLVGHYFRTIYNIVKYIENSNIEEENKKSYSNLLRAQLSKYEIGILLYNSISHYGKEKMLPLVVKYDLLKHIEADVVGDTSHLELIKEL